MINNTQAKDIRFIRAAVRYLHNNEYHNVDVIDNVLFDLSAYDGNGDFVLIYITASDDEFTDWWTKSELEYAMIEFCKKHDIEDGIIIRVDCISYIIVSDSEAVLKHRFNVLGQDK